MSELPKGELEFQDPLFRKGATESGLRKVEESIRAANEASLRARIAELERKLAIIVKWLEENQPDVFRRGLWDGISAPTAQALARLVEAAAELRQLWTGNENVWSKARTADAWGRFVRAVDAYQAARSGRGEGE